MRVWSQAWWGLVDKDTCLFSSPNFVPSTLRRQFTMGNTNWRTRKLLVTKQHSGESSYLSNMTITLGQWSESIWNFARIWHSSQFSPTNVRNSRASLVTLLPLVEFYCEPYPTTDSRRHDCCDRRFCLVACIRSDHWRNNIIVQPKPATWMLWPKGGFIRGLIWKSTSKKNQTLRIHRETSTSYSPSPEALTLSD